MYWSWLPLSPDSFFRHFETGSHSHLIVVVDILKLAPILTWFCLSTFWSWLPFSPDCGGRHFEAGSHSHLMVVVDMLKLAPILSVMSAREICHGPCFNFIYGWFFTIEASLIVEDFTISVYGSSCKYLFCSYCSLYPQGRTGWNTKK